MLETSSLLWLWNSSTTNLESISKSRFTRWQRCCVDKEYEVS